MFNTLLQFAKYIKYFALAIALNSFCNTNAGVLKKWFLFASKSNTDTKSEDKKNVKVEIPWENDNGCLADFQCIFKGQIIDSNNHVTTMQQMKDNVVIIVFSTTWCPNCPQIIRQMDSLNKKIEGLGIDNVKIIHLNIGDETLAGVKKHLKNIKVDLEAYRSVSGADVGVSIIPSVMIFNKAGKAVCGYMGSSFDYLSDEFVKFVISLSKQ